jgi:hypothetical protein
MMRKMLIATVGAIGLTAAPAFAAPTFTVGSFAFGGFTTATGPVATTLVQPLNPDAITLGSPVGSFALVSLPSAENLAPGAADFAPGMSAVFDWSDPSGIGSFNATNTTALGGPADTAAYQIDGSFTLGADWANAGTTLPAEELWNLTQVGGPGDATSIAGTHFVADVVPEPATLGLLGTAIIALAYLREAHRYWTRSRTV